MTLVDILPAIRQLSATEKLKLIRILAEDKAIIQFIIRGNNLKDTRLTMKL